MSLLLMSLLLILLLGIVLSCVIFRWLICTLAVRFFQTALNADLKIKSVGLFSVQGVSIQFHPQHTLEIDKIWISSKLLNQDLPRYLALCVGETRVRFDLQAPLRPLAKKSHGKMSGKISVSPTTLRFLSQLLSFHVSSINVMVLNIALSESLWHMTITGITLLLDHQSKRLAWDFSVAQLSSKVLKSSQLDICLAEVALSLLLSGDVDLPEMKPGCLSLSVRTLIAELHEGLFLSQLLLPPSPKKSIHDASECENIECIQTETVERFHQLIPHKVNVEFDNTNVTLSMHSQKRHLNWTLKSLKVCYGRDDEQLPLKSFTPELSFPQSSLELLLEDGLLLSQSRQRILCVNSLKTTLQVTSVDISGSFTVNTCIIHYRHQEFSHWLNLFPWEQLIHRKAAHRKRRLPHLDAPVMITSSVSNVNVSVQLGDTTPFALGFLSVSAELQHLLDIIDAESSQSQNVHQRASLSLDNFWWRVGQGSHIQQAPHPPGKHVWGEALILDSLSLQGSFNRPHMESTSRSQSLCVESSLKGLQVELSETCALCLSRLLSLICVPRDTGPQLSDVASVSPPSDDTVQPIPSSHLHLLFKLDCCLEDVNVFTLSNLAGAVSLRLDTVRALSTAENYTVSLQGVSLSAIKAITENMESCSPASETPNPVLKLTVIAFCYHITTHTLEVQCEEELTVEWTPPDHMVLYQHLTEAQACWCMLCGEHGEDSPVKPKESEIISGQSRGLSVRVELGCTRLTAHVSEQNYILLHTEALSVSKHTGSMHIRSPSMIFNFDGNNIVSFRDLDVEMHTELNEMQPHRDTFPFLTTPHNHVLVLTCPSMAVEFPYQYDFSNTFDMAISVQKWLKTLHRSPSHATTVQSLPPDLVIKISQFSFVFLDDIFEIKLRDNYELMKDESKESAKRLQLLDKKVADLRKQHGELLPARKIEELYSSLEKKHIEIYIQRSRRLYVNTPMRKSLLTWTVSDLELVALADESLHGLERVREQLRDIDRISPFPRDGLPLVVQWCRAVKFKLDAFLVRIRDYPRYLFEIREWELSGRLIGTEQDGQARAHRKEIVPLGPPWGDVTVHRNMPPLKFYYDFKSNISLYTIVWGPCWDPAWTLIGQSVDLLTKPTVDPSPPLAWWDKSRLLLHGRWVMDIDQANLHQLATEDPYNTTENLHWEWSKLNFDWNPGQFVFKGDLDVNVRTASKYDDIRFLQLPNLCMTLDLQWLCHGNPHDHHAVMLCCAENIADVTSGQPHDSYRAFRSENLNLSITMDLNQHCGTEPSQPRILLYSSTLRWMQNFWATWTGVSRPICRGKLFHSLRPLRKKLGQHYKQMSYTAAFPKLQVHYWASFAQQRGIQVECNKGHVFTRGAQRLIPQAGTVMRRLISEWNVTQMVSELSQVTVHLMASTWDETADHQINAQVKKTHLVSADLQAARRGVCVSLPQPAMTDKIPPQQGDPLMNKFHQVGLLNGKEATKDGLHARGQWANKAEFLLAVAGQIIGLGNVWRFPYLCYKNGGGVFFIPYLLFLVLCGVPLFLLETSLGQYTSLGGVSAWRTICPLFGGLGYASQVIILHGCVYYIVILAWALFYLCYSFQAELPWSHCNNTWNTETCVLFHHHNQTANGSLPENATSPVMEFWEREVLRLSSNLDELGPVSWKLALCLAVVWLICYFCVWKGVKSTGKVVYLTATFPYVMLFVLLVRGATLPGATQGIIYYLKPNHTRLADPQVWMDAGTQIFFSYGICLGSLTALGSYNRYNNDCYKDSFRLCLLNSGTSFLAGFAIFSVLGFMAEEQGVDIATVAQSGPGLAFIAYPRAVAMMPVPQLWAVCFFLMIIMLGLDTQFVSLEALMTSVTDLYPHLIRRGHRRELLLLFVCVVCFLIGLVMVTPGGLYVFQIYDHFSCSGASLLLLSIFQSLAIGWVYGAERFSANIRDMTGYSPLPFFKLCWKYLTPVVCTATFMFSLVHWSPLTLGKGLVAPAWANTLGWLLTFSSVSLLPTWAIYALATTPGTLAQRFQHLCSPANSSSLALHHPPTNNSALPYSPALPLPEKPKEQRTDVI